MAVNTVEKTYFDQSVLVVTFRGDVDINDLAHGMGMTSLYIENATTRPFILVDVSEIEEKSLSIVSLILSRSAALLNNAKDAKIFLVSGQGKIQDYLDIVRQDQIGLMALPIIPRYKQALTTIQMLLKMAARRHGVAAPAAVASSVA